MATDDEHGGLPDASQVAMLNLPEPRDILTDGVDTEAPPAPSGEPSAAAGQSSPPYETKGFRILSRLLDRLNLKDEYLGGFVEHKITDQLLLFILFGFLLVFWAAYFSRDSICPSMYLCMIVPRSADGLLPILFAPFLHWSLGSLLADTVLFGALAFFTIGHGRAAFWWATMWSGLIGGAGMWLVGGSGGAYLGSGTLVFGYFGFLIAMGVFERSQKRILIAVLLGVISIGITAVGYDDREDGLYWMRYLFSLIGGVTAAWLVFRKTKKAGIDSSHAPVSTSTKASPSARTSTDGGELLRMLPSIILYFIALVAVAILPWSFDKAPINFPEELSITVACGYFMVFMLSINLISMFAVRHHLTGAAGFLFFMTLLTWMSPLIHIWAKLQEADIPSKLVIEGLSKTFEALIEHTQYGLWACLACTFAAMLVKPPPARRHTR